jgi:hypothetical protein
LKFVIRSDAKALNGSRPGCFSQTQVAYWRFVEIDISQKGNLKAKAFSRTSKQTETVSRKTAPAAVEPDN